MATEFYKAKTLSDCETILPGFKKLWKQIKEETGTKQRCPKLFCFTDTVGPLTPDDHSVCRRYGVDLKTMTLSPGLHVSAGEWAAHGGSNNDQSVKSVPEGFAVMDCEWNDYYASFYIKLQVSEQSMPKVLK